MNFERLLNVARALRESPDPEKFSMGAYAHGCKTPACALGHYAFREDLQKAFSLMGKSEFVWERKHAVAAKRSGAAYPRDEYPVDYDDKVVCEHFDIEFEDACELFGADGCGDATTALEAAEWIEAFVARHKEAQPSAADERGR